MYSRGHWNKSNENFVNGIKKQGQQIGSEEIRMDTIEVFYS